MVSQSKRAANDRYDSKTYKRFIITLRLDEDKEIINALEEQREEGIPLRHYLHELIEGKSHFSDDAEAFIDSRCESGQTREDIIKAAIEEYAQKNRYR